MIEYEQANGRRQAALQAFRINRTHQLRQSDVAIGRDLLQPFPERLFKTDARFVTVYDDRALDDNPAGRAIRRSNRRTPHTHPTLGQSPIEICSKSGSADSVPASGRNRSRWPKN
jgi:hypothetical protein